MPFEADSLHERARTDSRATLGRDSEMSMATFVAHCGKDPNGKDDLETISFVVCGEAGRGSFGVVKKIRLLADGQVYALKKTAQDRRFKVS